jgi:hypothetical protein
VSDLKHDPVINAIQKGIKDDIDFNHNAERFRATILLIYAAMDTMAFLNMPAGQLDVTRKDFIYWAERYLKFPCKTQLTGNDLYGARCGILHTYSQQSKMSREGKCRMLLHVNNIPGDPVRDKGHPKFILVSIAGLKTALFAAIDCFLIDVFASVQKGKVVEKRLQKLLIKYDDVPGTDPHIRPFLEETFNK